MTWWPGAWTRIGPRLSLRARPPPRDSGGTDRRAADGGTSRGRGEGRERGRRPSRGARVRDALRRTRRTRLRARRPRRLRSRREAGSAGRVPVHPRRVPLDVPGPPVDDAAVRRVRHAGRDERALPVPARARAGRAVGRVRHADADGPRLRRPARGGRGRPLRRRHRHARGLRDALRPDPARRHLHVDDDQRSGGRGVRVLPRDRRAAGRAVGATRRHAADRHHEGVHRAEGVDLPSAPAPAPDRRPDGVLRRARASLAPGQRVRLSHPRGRRDGGAGARLHAGRRLLLRRARAEARTRGRHVRARPVVLLQRAHRLLRGDRETACGAADLGTLAARAVRRVRPQRDEAPVPHPDGRGARSRRSNR